VGTAISTLSPTVTGTVTSYSVSPSLPAGLMLDTTSGAIAGTPTTVTAAASYAITARNTSGSTSYDLSIAVSSATQFWLEPTTATIIGVGHPLAGQCQASK
jgi:hypothetical protein